MYLRKANIDTKCGVVKSDTVGIIEDMKWYNKIKGLMADRNIKQKALMK